MIDSFIISKKEVIQMMSIQDLMKIHVKDNCKYCSRKNCDGIRINTKGKTVCEVYK